MDNQSDMHALEPVHIYLRQQQYKSFDFCDGMPINEHYSIRYSYFIYSVQSQSIEIIDLF